MGLGDELMAAGEAWRRHHRDPARRKVAIADRRGHARWHELWEGNPAIATPHEAAVDRRVLWVRNGQGCRPYIRYPFTRTGGMRFTEWRARDHTPVLFLTEAERRHGEAIRARLGPFVVIEPDVKLTSTQNKSWGRERFAEVVKACPEVTFVRLQAPDAHPFAYGVRLPSMDFRQACGVLAASEGYLGPEGAMHHAAAALKKPAVVIFGGFISPETTGYPSHINLADTHSGSPCGRWLPCEHCRDALDRITVQMVVEAVQRMTAGDLQRTA